LECQIYLSAFKKELREKLSINSLNKLKYLENSIVEKIIYNIVIAYYVK